MPVSPSVLSEGACASGRAWPTALRTAVIQPRQRHEACCSTQSVFHRRWVHCSSKLEDLPYLRYVGTKSTGKSANLHLIEAGAAEADDRGAATDGICYRKALWGAIEREQLTAPLITKPDDFFEKQGLEFVYDTDQLVVEELIELFQKVGFPKRNADTLTKALDASHKIIWIRHAKQTRWAKLGQLLGFARATSDHVVSATIWDVAVNPLWQRGGLGRGLVERLVAALVADGVNAVNLFAEPNVVRMYEKLGFLQDPSKVQGLSFQRTSPAGVALVASCKA